MEAAMTCFWCKQPILPEQKYSVIVSGINVMSVHIPVHRECLKQHDARTIIKLKLKERDHVSEGSEEIRQVAPGPHGAGRSR
jgi:hypothetical protein